MDKCNRREEMGKIKEFIVKQNWLSDMLDDAKMQNLNQIGLRACLKC